MNDVTAETSHHTIQATTNGLTIQAKDVPDTSINLDIEETKELLELLLIWQGGLETIPPNDLNA